MSPQKLNLIFGVLLFILGTPTSAFTQTTPPTSPDCRHVVQIDYAYSDFFKYFAWVHRKALPRPITEGVLYWLAFQEELTQKYGYLEDPPAELILKNQLCHMLQKRMLNSADLADEETLKWFKKQGPEIIQQIKAQSLKLRNDLISKRKMTQLAPQEQAALDTAWVEIQAKVRKDHF